ncbi:unnamed protein product [Moneuplotes crassus]|uniref:Uncharacterized protein n=1 Tax=Euplotes crassus TaxID=5936 RepID=A0AAD2D359_EUPCR|nr:unnamed protein product [Moneuplotes crassus]
MKNLVAFACILGLAFCAVAVDLDADGVADVVVPNAAVATVVEPTVTVADPWLVRDGWRGAYDWTGDGIIDWRDDFVVGGVKPWEGDWIRADWNRDGVIDWQDGWRRFGNEWTTGAWDPTWRGDGWRADTVSVREVPAGFYTDSEWRTVEGPWDTFGWGGRFVGDWNRDGVIDFKDDLAWRTGITSVVEAPVVAPRVIEGGPVRSRVVEGPVVANGFGRAPTLGPRRVF